MPGKKVKKMYFILIIIHIIVCIILIATILLQAGRGGGLTEAFGGSETIQSVLGTQAPVVLKRATEISAVVFLITSLALGMIASRKGRSLFEQMRLPAVPAATQQDTSQTAVPAAQTKEMPPVEPVTQSESQE